MKFIPAIHTVDSSSKSVRRLCITLDETYTASEKTLKDAHLHQRSDFYRQDEVQCWSRCLIDDIN